MCSSIVITSFSDSFFYKKKKTLPRRVSLELNKLVSHTTLESSQSFYYTLQYRCASLTEDCNGVMITDPLPPEVGEPGINGVRVELYLDDGDGVTNPEVDSFINFTVTGGGGYNIFPEIPAGDYYAILDIPSGHVATLLNQGMDDELDSDGVVNIIGTDSVAIKKSKELFVTCS